MPFEQRDNSGAIFKNEKKTSENHPHMTGTAMIGGVKYYVSAWTKEGNKGRFQSLSFKPVDEKQNKNAYKDAEHGFEDFEDDIPF